MNDQQLDGKYEQLKAALKARWSRLSNEELDYFGGHKDLFVSAVKDHYGLSLHEAQAQVDGWEVPAGWHPHAKAI